MIKWLQSLFGKNQQIKISPEKIEEQRQNQLTKMISFIENDTEIMIEDLKENTRAEVGARKNKIIREGKVKLNKEFLKNDALLDKDMNIRLIKIKRDLEMQKQTALHEIVQDIHDTVRQNTKKRISDPKILELLKKFVTGQILEAALRLNESKIFLEVRPEDVEMMSSIVPNVETYFEEEMCKPLDIELIEGKHVWGEDSLGGSYVHNGNMHIEIDCTIDARIAMCVEEMKPWIMGQMIHKERKN